MWKFVISLFTVSFIVSCSSEDKENNATIDALQLEIASLKEQTIVKDSTENHFISHANEIHENLNSISIKQKEIVNYIKSNPTAIKNGDTLLSNQINSLDNLIDKNNDEINRFKNKVDSSKIENGSFNQLMGHITTDIDGKNKEILNLQEQINSIDVMMEDLFDAFGETAEELDETKKSLLETKKYMNTVWYVSGTKKELEEKGITASTGGFIGIGKNEELKTEFNIAQFKKGNKKDLRTIEIQKGNKIVELVTSHPKSSYSINGLSINIENTNDFWSISKYLVIVVK